MAASYIIIQVVQSFLLQPLKKKVALNINQALSIKLTKYPGYQHSITLYLRKQILVAVNRIRIFLERDTFEFDLHGSIIIDKFITILYLTTRFA